MAQAATPPSNVLGGDGKKAKVGRQDKLEKIKTAAKSHEEWFSGCAWWEMRGGDSGVGHIRTDTRRWNLAVSVDARFWCKQVLTNPSN